MSEEMTPLQIPISRRNALRAAGLIFVGGSIFGLDGCGSSSSKSGTASAGTPKSGGSVQVAVGDASVSENLDPQRPWNQNNSIYVPLVYETLLVMDAQFNLNPALVESYSSDSAAKVWTFKLRQGVKFHDGTPLRAQDVVWSIQRLFESSLASPIYGPLAAVLERKNVKATDEHTVVATLSHPDAFFPVIFSTTGTEIIKAGQNKFTLANAIGTGPFKFSAFQAGQGWTVVRNPTYWKAGLPYLDQVRGVSIPDPTGMVEAVTSGAAHISTSISFSQIPVVSAAGGAKVLTEPAFFDSYLVMNAKHKPFDDVRVRQAIKLATNRQLVNSTAYLGHGVLTSDTPAPSTDQFYPAALGIRAQNIAKAKSLLSEAGYPNGLKLTLYTSDLLGGMVDMAVAFAKTVSAAGIDITLEQHPAATYFEQIWLNKPFYTTWVYRRHPSIRVPMTLASYSAWPETQIPNTKVDSLLASAQAATDTATQKSRMGTLLEWVADNDGYGSSAFEDLAIAAKQTLQGVSFPQGKGPNLSEAWLS